MLYLSGASNTYLREVCYEYSIGLMIQPNNGYVSQVADYPFFAVDNACFSQIESYSDDKFSVLLSKLPRESCLFAVAPDVVGNHDATLSRFAESSEVIRAAGFPVAFVAQDGITVENTPWSKFEALFIGGSTDFKLSDDMFEVVCAARSLGKWVHMGRVNSLKRLRIAKLMGCDSADGNFLAFGPQINLRRLLSWLEHLQTYTTLPFGRGA